MEGKKKVLLNSVFYTFSSILIKSFSFILLPVYTLYLSPADYGVTTLVISFTAVMSIVSSLSLKASVTRFYADYKHDQEKLKSFYSTILIFVFIFSVLISFLGYWSKDFLIKYFFNEIAFYPIILIALLNLIFACQHSLHQSIMMGRQEGKKYTIINLIVFILTVVANLIFLAVFNMGAEGVLLATLIINIAYFFFMIIDLIRNNLINFSFNHELLVEALKYSIPIIPHNLSTSIASWVSRVVLNKNESLTAVGLYSVANQFGLIIDTIQSSVNSAFAPWFYEMLNEKDKKTNLEIVSLSQFLLIIYSLIYMIIGLFSQEALLIMTNEKYDLAWTVIPIFVVAYSVKSIYFFYINILFYYKEATKKIFYATLTGSFADIILAVILVPKFQMYGSALAFLIAKILVVSIVIKMSKNYKHIGYKLEPMLKIIIPSLIFMFAGLIFSYTNFLTEWNWYNVLYKFLVFTIYLLYIYMMHKEKIKKFYRSFKLKKQLNKKG